MPLIVPDRERFPVYDVLERARVFIIDDGMAQRQDIRPLRIGLLNLMPAAVREKTEVQFYRLLGNSPLQIQPVLIRFDNYLPATGKERIEYFYEPVATVKERGLDGLVVTGANLELDATGDLLDFHRIHYYAELCQVLDWARANVFSTVYSCLGSHFALHHFYGINRDLSPEKVFGVFRHAVNRDVHTDLVEDINDSVWAPHSRWGNVPTASLAQTKELQVVMDSPACGWLMAIGRDGREVYIQGHPEYDRDDLAGEYVRDKRAGGRIACPANYFVDDDETRPPVCNWKADAAIFYRNWVNFIYQHSSFEHDADEAA
ncbi:Homoserine O-succinyltransferase [Plasmodiophora brassicae]|uniref:Homoserine O-succinyltransferase n=1 Tax=Plasmodiophora brassicae TaxID=37360 RepID=A0A0G4IRQ3_PLABS|nr:hypothetical protein PBRA_006167 [Plasmodiophora brassicae]SPQ96126.1 unnamed protein product [Plasmodiophora brassicae]